MRSVLAAFRPRRARAGAFWMLTVIALAAASAPCAAQCGEQERQKFFDAALAPADHFGRSIAVSGDVALVGAFTDDTAAVDAGAAYVYRFNALTSQWEPEQQLLANNARTGDQFGVSVDVDGNVAVVGARFGDGLMQNSGAAYVYRFDGVTWLQESKLFANDGQVFDTFGTSVAVQGNCAVVGAEDDDIPAGNAGSAYVFQYNGSNWAFTQKLVSSDAQTGDEFGFSAAMDGSVIAIGARDEDNAWGNEAGAVYLYRFDGSMWNQEEKLISSAGLMSDLLGHSVAVSGDVVVAGALRGLAGDEGYAEVHRFDGSVWQFEQRLLAAGALPFDQAGSAVAVDGDVVVLGAQGDNSGGDPGYACTFRRDGSTWVDVLHLTASDGAPGDQFGIAVAVDGNTVLVGAQSQDSLMSGIDQGAAYWMDVTPFSLDASPSAVAMGDTLAFTTELGTEDSFILLRATAVAGGNGSRFPWSALDSVRWLLRLHGGRFPAHFQWVLPLVVPPYLEGLTVTYEATALADCGGILHSNPVVVTFQ